MPFSGSSSRLSIGTAVTGVKDFAAAKLTFMPSISGIRKRFVSVRWSCPQSALILFEKWSIRVIGEPRFSGPVIEDLICPVPDLPEILGRVVTAIQRRVRDIQNGERHPGIAIKLIAIQRLVKRHAVPVIYQPRDRGRHVQALVSRLPPPTWNVLKRPARISKS
jgi:hypothetical protein